MFIARKIQIFVIPLIFILFSSCMKDLEPLPGDIKDMTMSWSLPIAKVELGLGDIYSVGLPNYWLAYDVPSWAKFEEVYFTDTLAVDLSKVYEKSSEINYLAFRINIWNEFPAVAKAQLSFTDATYSNLYSFNSVDINRGVIIIQQADAIVVNPGVSTITIPFEKNQIESLRTASNLIIRITISLRKDDTNPNSFSHWNTLKLTCGLGARVDFVLNNI